MSEDVVPRFIPTLDSTAFNARSRVSLLGSDLSKYGSSGERRGTHPAVLDCLEACDVAPSPSLEAGSFLLLLKMLCAIVPKLSVKGQACERTFLDCSPADVINIFEQRRRKS